MLLTTVNGPVKKEVFKYEVVWKNELDDSKPITTLALGMDTLGNCKIPSEKDKNQLLHELLPMGRISPMLTGNPNHQ